MYEAGDSWDGGVAAGVGVGCEPDPQSGVANVVVGNQTQNREREPIVGLQSRSKVPSEAQQWHQDNASCLASGRGGVAHQLDFGK